jgi:hypothetical protein
LDPIAIIDAVFAIEAAAQASTSAIIALANDFESEPLRSAARDALDDERSVLLSYLPNRCWQEYYLARWEAQVLGNAASAILADSGPDAVTGLLTLRSDASDRGDEQLAAGFCGLPPFR